jgi:hypothetical protein
MSPPSSLPPAGIPSQGGGNAKYAIVAVVLLLGAGGLFLLRSSPKPPDTPPVPTAVPSTSASSVATNNPLMDDIPPPPPPEVTPEGGKPNVVYVQGSTGCDSKVCTGKAPGELGQILQMRANQARRCYNAALAQDSTLKGHVSIAVRIGAGGAACSANVASNDMGSPGVAACAANVFRSGAYPAPVGGCVDAVVPMSFVPMGGQ